MQLSMCGYSARLECLRPKEHMRPNITPRAIEIEKESKKIPIPWKREDK
jgi:hypothetical protein